MARFKDSIRNAQMTLNADPAKWVPTGSLLHTSKNASLRKPNKAHSVDPTDSTRHFKAPPNFRITFNDRNFFSPGAAAHGDMPISQQQK